MEIHITCEWSVRNPAPHRHGGQAGASGGRAHLRATAPLLATPLQRVVNNPRPG
jgi:hypothetical protein